MTTLAASSFLQSSSIEHFLRANTAPTSSAYLSLYKSSPDEDDSGTEITGSGYENRMLLNFEVPTIATSSITSLIGITASANLGVISHFGIHDSAATGSGNLLAYGQLSSSLSGTDGYIISFDSGSLTLTWADDITHTFGNQLINHFFRATEQVTSSAYLGLATADPGASGTLNELSAGGYSRRLLSLNHTPDGTVSSSLAANFTATEDWGNVTHGVIWLEATASLSAAFKKPLETAREVSENVTLTFPVDNITIKMQ